MCHGLVVLAKRSVEEIKEAVKYHQEAEKI